jgi:Tfp pilus assembly protein PilF
MSTSTPTTQKPSGSFRVAIENLSAFLDVTRKLLISCLVIIVTIILLIFIFYTYGKKRLIIHPIASSTSLQSIGYSGDILTTMLVEKVKQIESEGSIYYKSNEVILSSWENEVDEISSSISSSSSALTKYIFDFLDKKSISASGEIINSAKGLKIQFRITGVPAITARVDNISDSGIDELLTMAAEYILKQVNPYVLADYYLTEKKDKKKCLEIVQGMLNADDPENIGFANNLRGVIYMDDDPQLAKQLFLKAIQTIKSPWLTYNNLGVLCNYLNEDDSAALLFREAIAINSKQYNPYLNYGNLMYKKYNIDTSKRYCLDSAELLYKEGIKYGKTLVPLYVALLPALYDEGKVDEAKECYLKCIEMNPSYYLAYYQMGRIFLSHKEIPAALQEFALAESVCKDQSEKLEIVALEESLKKTNNNSK